KKKALEIEEYRRDKNLNKKKDSTIPEENQQASKADVDIDSFVSGLAVLSINRVENEEKLSRKTSSKKNDEYLKIELLNENECGDVQVFGKRKRENDVNETIPLNKKEKIREATHDNEK
ncbi:32656_t:CDS:2, partial [Racocetra persica]